MKGTDPKEFRILSLDGGGIRGAFIAGFLADIEQRLQCRIGDYFDLIAGTSTGAIIAAALAVHEPAAKIEQFYRDRGPSIFTRRHPLPLGCLKGLVIDHIQQRYLSKFGLDYDNLQQSKYESAALRGALSFVFGERKIEDAKTRLLIPAVDMTRGQTIVFKTPHFPNLFRDRHYAIVDVLMATTAAPTYFPHATIEPGSAYVDGGVWMNNPSMGAIVEALKIRQEANRPDLDVAIDQESIYLLSVGTGRASYFADPPEGGAGVLWWAPHLFDVSAVAQSQGINFQAKYLLGDRAYRIDYDLPDGNWSLDRVDMIDKMVKIGHERSSEHLAELRDVFFHCRAMHPYHPFPDMKPVTK
jgi:uncharacterized protein